MKKQYAVIGHPLTHTMSPFIHNSLFRLSGMDIDYKILDIGPACLKDNANLLSELAGFNITIPHKQSIIPFLSDIHDSAKEYMSINTVSCQNGAMIGFNTDAFGFITSLSSADIPLEGKVLLMGCGGVARTMATEAVKNGCHVTLGIRPDAVNTANSLVSELVNLRANCADVAILSEIKGEFDLAINATPVGMYPKTNSMPITTKQLSNCRSLFEAVYNPKETMLLKSAKQLGIKCVGGMPMLVIQAAKAHSYWYDAKFKQSDINDLIELSYIEMERLYE